MKFRLGVIYKLLVQSEYLRQFKRRATKGFHDDDKDGTNVFSIRDDARHRGRDVAEEHGVWRDECVLTGLCDQRKRRE